MFSDRSHGTLPDMSNSIFYQKMIQEQMMHENKIHDVNFPALVASTRVPKLKKVIDNGCLFFGDPNADDDDAAEDVATADEDEDETGFSCVAGFSCGAGSSCPCENAHDVGSGGMRGLGGKRGHIITGRNEENNINEDDDKQPNE